jgi:hypothetical protein
MLFSKMYKVPTNKQRNKQTNERTNKQNGGLQVCNTKRHKRVRE